MDYEDRKENSKKVKLGITIGDYNGVGPEIILKVFSDKRMMDLFIPIIYGSGRVLSWYKKHLNIDVFSHHQYHEGSYVNEKKVNVISCWKDPQQVDPGKKTTEAGKCAIQALEKAKEDLKTGFIDGIVTCPISKETVQDKNFTFPGHTEFFQDAFSKEKKALMLMVSEQMRVGVLSGHIPLEEVKSKITRDSLIQSLKILTNSIKGDFRVEKPKIAVLGLNPHAGDNGLLGKEENEIIKPTIAELYKKGNLVFGPYSADGFFGAGLWKKFDAVLAMYHDQGIIPFKTICFNSGVNYTAGLSIVRTSPDHGTAFDIAGKNIADETSLREAIYLALDVIKARKGAPENKMRVVKEDPRLLEKLP